VVAASYTCQAYALAARLPEACSDLLLGRCSNLLALERHLSARSRTAGGPQCFVPFLRVTRLRVTRPWPPRPVLPRVLAFLHHLRRLSHVVVREAAVWHALPPQAYLTKVYVDLASEPVTHMDVCRVAVNPATVTELGGNLVLTAPSAPAWKGFPRLRTLRLDRPGAIAEGDAAAFAGVWPELDRLEVRIGAHLPPGAAAFVSAVVQGRGPGAVTLVFLGWVPRPPTSMPVMHLAELRVDNVSQSLLLWLQRVRADRVVADGWCRADADRVPYVDVLVAAALHTQAREVVLHGVGTVRTMYSEPVPDLPPLQAARQRMEVVRVRVSRQRSQRSMAHADQLAQIARWADLCVFTFADGQLGVDVVAAWLQGRLGPRVSVEHGVEHGVVACRRM